MRIVCLLFPRLAVQLARRTHTEAPRALILLAGEGDEALVSAASPEASAAGVTVGMLATTARGHSRTAHFLADNAGDCLETLEAIAAILRTRATTSVALGGVDHLFLDLAGLDNLFIDEATAAAALAALVRTWGGLEVRAGVGGSRACALAAARTARHGPVVRDGDHLCSEAGAAAGRQSIAPWRAEELAANASLPADADARVVRARLVRLLASLETILDGRAESFREVTVTMESPMGRRTSTVRSHAPLHSAAEALALLSNALAPEAFEPMSSITVTFARLGPAVRVHAMVSASPPVFLGPPMRPRQAPLLRAS
ncbi:MAG: hypothetical protein ACRDG3_08995 [Tepidiformaceae bacterium]